MCNETATGPFQSYIWVCHWIQQRLQDFHRFWSVWWLWILLSPILIAISTLSQVLNWILHIPENLRAYKNTLEKFKLLLFVPALLHSILRLPFLIFHSWFLVFKRIAIWRERETIRPICMDTPYWYDTLLLRSIGIIIYRKQIVFRYQCWASNCRKDKDIDQGFTVEEQRKIIEKSSYVIVLIYALCNFYYMFIESFSKS